jgi:hypothetical protein
MTRRKKPAGGWIVKGRWTVAALTAVMMCGLVLQVWINDGRRSAGVRSGSVLLHTPWASVGGCGAGGSGGGSADAIRWIGQGVTGGLLDVEMLPKYNFGQNYKTLTVAPRLSFKPANFGLAFMNYSTVVGLRLPIMSKSGEVQYRTNQPAYDRTTGGIGDLTVDIMRSVGLNFKLDLQLGLTFPTGQYDIRRGPDAASEFLPINLQKGGGVYNAAFTVGHSRDVENGMWMFEAVYNFPFNMKPISGENEFLDGGEYFAGYRDSTSNPRFHYRFKHYGENDLGGYTPPSVNASVYYAYRGVENFVHSFGLVFAAPTAVAWIHSEKTNQYDPRPDPDHKTWNAALIYGLEFSHMKYPVFMAVSLPIQDKKGTPNPDNEYDPGPMEKWDGPDWEDFLQQWTFAIGFKSTMF